MANRTLTTLTAVLQMNNSKFKKGIKGSQKSLTGFQKQVKNIGGMIAGTFAITAITRFTKEAVQLASQMEGVGAAFNNLGRPGLLNELQKATRGTVTNLELMKAAVQAKNFRIPLERLGTFFDFATSRAIQTGESVEYLTQSIITGIGRKSVLVMDNLGISAAELQEEIKKVGDFGEAAGNIIERAMADAGDVASTAATQIAQMSTAWENFKTSVGGSKVIMFTIRNIGEALEGISKILNRGAGGGLDEYFEFSKTLKDKSVTEQQGLLTAEIERQRKALEELAKKRREQIKLANDERRVVRKFAETEIDKLDEIQTPLIEILRFFEGQLEALTGINNELDETANKLKEIKQIDPWTPEPGFDFGLTGTGEGGYKSGRKIHGLDWTKDPDINKGLATTLDLMGSLDGAIAEWEVGWQEAGDTTFAAVDKIKTPLMEIGDMIGMSLVNQVGALGEAIGQFASGAEGAFNSLGDSIMQNLGNILIMMAAQMGPAGLPLLLAGIGLQLGGGLIRGLGNNANMGTDNTNGNDTVIFKIAGNDLVGALERNSNEIKRFT